MKKILTTLLLVILSFVAVAQTNTITFLGIPVDGSKSVIEQRLRKEKGFFYENDLYEEAGFLSGNFNGYRVRVAVYDYNGLVRRVAVILPDVSETQVKIQYNNLFNQLKNNEKYLYRETDCSGELSEEEDISYEISVNDKQYQNVFFYPPWGTLNEFIKSLKEAENPQDVLEEERFADLVKSSFKDGELDGASSVLWAMNNSEGKVWYTIGKATNYGQYHIIIFYDNIKNEPNGEDL